MFAGTPSDDLPDVLATGRGDTTTVFVSMSARHPDGRDVDYLRWHALDHRPEQHRLAGLRGSLRVVSTPACRVARSAADEAFEATDHVVAYLFADPSALGPFLGLGRALGAGERMPLRLPSVALGAYAVTGRVAAPRVLVGADVVPWRPAAGAYLLVEEGEPRPGDELVEVDGVAGAWWCTPTSDGVPPGAPWSPAASGDGTPTQLTWCFLDDDPVAVAGRLAPVVARRGADGSRVPRLAAPFVTVVPFAWDRHLP